MDGDKLLTKSNFLAGLQCSKYLWIKLNDKQAIPKLDKATQYKFKEGHQVNKLAKKFFPDGIDIPTEDFAENIKQTKILLSQNKTLFEAGILIDNIYSRIDVLRPAEHGTWDILEVKSSTEVKDINLDDVSFQRYCCEQLGLKIRKCFLMYVNNQYVKQGDIDPSGFFKVEDISGKVDAAIQGIREKISKMIDVSKLGEYPKIQIGKHCKKPYDCPLTEYCWSFLPSGNVFELYYGGDKSHKLFASGVYSIKDIPANIKLTERQEIQKACQLTNQPHINRGAIKAFLDTLDYPVYYLDFETFDPCVPLFDGTRPYQKIPFQFSLHVFKDDSSKIEHYSFLAEGIADPRLEFLIALKNVLCDKGNIIVYNQVFEKNILKELGENFPNFKEWQDKITDRITDLLAPFQAFDYHHPKQNGSASIKSVLPVLTEKSYEKMDISDGEKASIAFVETNYSDCPEEQRKKVREDLEQYCSLDTEGMLLIMEKLKELVK